MTKNSETTVALSPVRKNRVSDQVLVQLTHRIVDGAYPVGEKLPPERELATRMSVNRTSLREALRKMESMGLVKIRQGDGIFVQDPTTHAGLEFMKFLLANHIGLDARMILALAEVRRIFAVALIELAVDRLDERTLDALQAMVDDYPRQATAERLTGERDFAFFQKIAQGTDNPVFLYMLNTIRDVFKQISVMYYQVEGDPGTARRVYGDLVAALRARDKNRAVAVFRAQMDRDDETLARLLGADHVAGSSR